jgi:cold shock CspA family protein
VSLPKDPGFDESERLNAPPPAEPRGTARTAVGTVKFWKDNKGYGAIACPETAPWDIWFHYSTFPREGIATLPTGEKVAAKSNGHSGTRSNATGELLGPCVFVGTGPPIIVHVGASVEVDFIRADQESFKYVAERVRLLKP